jgi:hypothetical protein
MPYEPDSERAQYLTERRRMMQHWADYLDSLLEANNVLAFGTERT